MPWANIIFNDVNILTTVKSIVCSKMSRKEKLLVPKWDSLKNMSQRIKQRMGRRLWMQNVHMKSMKSNMQLWNVFSDGAAFQFGVVSQHKRKLIQFYSIFLLLRKKRPMTNYESFKAFFDFEIEKKFKEMLEWCFWLRNVDCIHNKVMATLKEAMSNASYVALTADEIMNMDNQNWISIHGYV